MPSRRLRAALAHSISAIGSTSAHAVGGSFLQVSSALKISWYYVYEDGLFTPTLALVYIYLRCHDGCDSHSSCQNGCVSHGSWSPLDDAQTYSVAMPDFLSGGGDGYSGFVDQPKEQLQVGCSVVGYSPLTARFRTSYFRTAHR